MEKCPNCGLINPPKAQRCDCGCDFVTGNKKWPEGRAKYFGRKATKMLLRALALTTVIPLVVFLSGLLAENTLVRILVFLVMIPSYLLGLLCWYIAFRAGMESTGLNPLNALLLLTGGIGLIIYLCLYYSPRPLSNDYIEAKKELWVVNNVDKIVIYLTGAVLFTWLVSFVCWLF